MKNDEKVYDTLMSNGFKLVTKDVSAFFGDSYDVFSNGIIQLRFSSSKSFKSIDIRDNHLDENWYDLALVKALLYDEKNLNHVTTFEEYKDFLQNELINIVKLFVDNNYLTTQKRLEELGNERAKQMFPMVKW